MSTTHYSNPDSQATFPSQSTKPILDQQLPVASKHNLLFEAAIRVCDFANWLTSQAQAVRTRGRSSKEPAGW